jgi:hypothetical protein
MLKLREHGHFTAAEWSAALGQQLQHATSLGKEPQDAAALGKDLHDATHHGDPADFYQHWLSALESLVLGKGLTDRQSLLERKEAWADAYRHTPHGKPIELD